MSRAFTNEEVNENAIADLGERPISSHRNLVTTAGLAAIEAEIAQLRLANQSEDIREDKTRLAVNSRDLRYWLARHESAELVVPDPHSELIRFGMSATIEDEDGTRNRWTIVGEDEADPTKGLISHISPMARSLFGKGIGDFAIVNGKEWEVVAIG